MASETVSQASQWSGALKRRLQANPDLEPWLQTACQQPIDAHALANWFESLAGEHPDTAVLSVPDCRRVLRQLRERVFYAAMVRDLARQASLDEVTTAMTRLAEIAVEQAYRSVMQEMVARHGAPLDPVCGKPMEMIIVGMGKLGGGELNVSSDIDLIMLYGCEGETEGPRPLSYHEFFGNVTRRMMPIISEADEHGQVFRTDLRLRPDGDAGPLAWSLDAFEQYLFTQGREWERYAWLKGRIMPATYFADSDMSRTEQDVESMRQPFVYRKYFDFDALAALRDLRERIRQDWQRRASARQGVDTAHNIKLGDGGIREIEFVVQLTQLIRGGKMPRCNSADCSQHSKPSKELACCPMRRPMSLSEPTYSSDGLNTPCNTAKTPKPICCPVIRKCAWRWLAPWACRARHLNKPCPNTGVPWQRCFAMPFALPALPPMKAHQLHRQLQRVRQSPRTYQGPAWPTTPRICRT